MKLLSQDEMLEIVEASEADRNRLAQRLAPVIGDQADWFNQAVKDPRKNIVTIKKDGVPLGSLWWWYSAGNRTLVCNAGASLRRDLDTTPAFIEAYRLLAAQVGAKQVEIQTRRAGIVKVYQRHGFHIEGVVMRMAV